MLRKEIMGQLKLRSKVLEANDIHFNRSGTKYIGNVKSSRRYTNSSFEVKIKDRSYKMAEKQREMKSVGFK